MMGKDKFDLGEEFQKFYDLGKKHGYSEAKNDFAIEQLMANLKKIEDKTDG